MSIWRQITRGLRVLGNRKSADRDVADEVGHYLEEAAARFVEKGHSPEEARRAALLELGNVTAVREQVREYGWENTIETLIGDLRYAMRRLRRARGFTVASLLTLALGIGATTTIFSVINGVLLKPLPYEESDRIVVLRHTAPGINIPDIGLAASLYFTYTDESHVFQDIGMWRTDTATVTGVGEPEEVPTLNATHGLLRVLRVQAALGRAFTNADDDPRSERTVMLTDGYWKSRFGGDRSVIGRRILLDGDAHEVIGVLPPSFQFLERKMSLMLPFRVDRAQTYLISFCCTGIARLKPGVTIAQANADVARMLPMTPAKFPVNPGFSLKNFTEARLAPRLRPLKDYVLGDIGSTLWLLMAAVAIVLSIACANVANLMLVRAEGRQQELAVRAALGAGWGRIARELLMESLLLGVTGGALGLALAYLALRMLAASDVAHLPRTSNISIDATVVAFTVAISLASALLFGLIPVLRYARPRISSALHSGGRSASDSRERHAARNLLVVVQVALALILLIGSGLMMRTFQALRHIDPGFSGAPELETLHISIPDTMAPEGSRAIRMEEEILRKVGAVAGVTAVGLTDMVPLQGGSENEPIYVEEQAAREVATPPIRRMKFISPGYISAIGSRLIAGRDLTWSDTYNETLVALISENMAREVWHDPGVAVGKRIRYGLKDDWREVIGVVADLRDDGIDQKAPAIVYWPLLMKNFVGSKTYAVRDVAFLIRTPRAGTAGLLKEIQQAVASVIPNLPVADVKTLQSIYDRSLARTSFTLLLLAIAGGMALLLGVIGIYGVISYAVSQRTREIGIRLALGAPLKHVTSVFVRQGLVLSGCGAVCGLSAAFLLTRLMTTVLYEVSPVDPLTYGAVSVGLIAAAALASYLPARRATQVDPSEALRTE